MIRLVSAIRLHPIEVLLSVFFCCIGCFNFEKKDSSLDHMLIYFPVLFLITYTLSGLTERIRFRWLYYASLFFCIPFLWYQVEIWSATYLVSLLVVQLLFLVSSRKRDNDDFMQVGLFYLKALFSALLISCIAFLLLVSIYYSIQYIFEVWQGSDTRFLVYASYIAFVGVMPLLFVMFNQEIEEDKERNDLFDVLLNYVLTPALLVYAAILYLYFIKIVILWSLPKGAVAYIVVSFISVTFLLRGCQTFLSRKYFDWFYKYASLVVLPALVMYWVGVYYRINQYGFTEARVYLVVVGLILSGVVFLFLSERWGRYLYVSCLTIALLSLVTYIPGITAKDIERISQTRRGNYPNELVPADSYYSVNIETQTPVDIQGYRTLYPVRSFKASDSMFGVTVSDTFYLYDKEENIIFKENLADLLNRQLRKYGVASGDSIRCELYGPLLQLELDSALLVLENVYLFRYSQDSSYSISYMNPAYYLKK